MSNSDYVIEKLVSPGSDPNQEISWVAAWGLKSRSYPRASNDQQAIAIFRTETAKCRTPHRLIRWSSWGFSAGKEVLAKHGYGDAETGATKG